MPTFATPILISSITGHVGLFWRLLHFSACNNTAGAAPTGIPHLSGVATVELDGGNGHSIRIDASPYMPTTSQNSNACAALASNGTGSNKAIALVFANEIETPQPTAKPTILGLEVDAYRGPGSYDLTSPTLLIDGTQYTIKSGLIDVNADGSGQADITGNTETGDQIEVSIAYVCED